MRSLSDTWHGRFSYPLAHPENEFVCTLLEAGTALTGAIHEVHNHGDHAGAYLVAAISGTHDGARVNFVKTYDASVSPPTFTVVHYEGILSPDENEIAGTWRYRTAAGGRFVMIRANRRAFEAAREAAAPVRALAAVGAPDRTSGRTGP